MSTMDRIEPQVVNTKLEDIFEGEEFDINLHDCNSKEFCILFLLCICFSSQDNSRGYIFSGDPQE